MNKQSLLILRNAIVNKIRKFSLGSTHPSVLLRISHGYCTNKSILLLLL